MAFGNGPKIVSQGLTILFDTNSPGGTNGTNTLYNAVPGGPISSVALYPTSTFGYITSGSVFVSGSNNNSNSGSFLFGAGDLSSTINNDFTTNNWVYRQTTRKATICEYRGSGLRLEFCADDTSMYFNQRQVISPFTVFTTSVSVTNALNKWDYFSLSKSGTNWSFYKNGSLVGTTSFTMSETIATGASISLGIAWSDDDYLSNTMVGFIGPFTHYNRALMASEVLQNYNAQKSRFGL
jgi:hypothetical protein